MNKEFYKQSFNTKKNEAFIRLIDNTDEQTIRKGLFNPINNNVSAVLDEGSKIGLVLRLQDPFNFLISEDIYKSLLNKKITGWKSFEVDIENVNEKYYCLQITGRCGLIERHENSGFVTGIDFEESSWDGSDIFLPEDTMMMFCTEKVKTIFDEYKISNIEFKNIKKVRWYNT